MAREIGVQVNVPAGGEVQTEVNMPGDIEVGVTLDMNDTVSAKVAEAWAVGERGGVPVSSGDETYHNNSKWYAQQAAGSAGDAATAKTGAQTAQGLAETAQGKAETAQGKAETAQGKAETAQGKAETAMTHYPKIQNGTWWVWNVSGETWSDTGVKATGEWQIVKTYASIAAMEADYSGTDVKIGEFVMIVSTVEDPDNAKLYVKGSSAWVFIVDMSGATGIQGPAAYVHIKWSAAQPTQDSDMKNTADAWMGVCSDNNQSAPTTYTSYTWNKVRGEDGTDGITPQFSVGTVSGLPHGNDPTVSIDNTDPAHPVISLGIPAGASGNETIDDTAGLGDTDLVWSADKNVNELSQKAPASILAWIESSTKEEVKTVTDAAEGLPMVLDIDVEPVQDLHGQESPYPGGAGKNKLNYDAFKTSNWNRCTVTFENNGVTMVATGDDANNSATAAYVPEGAKIPVSEGETVTFSWDCTETTNLGSVYIFPNGSSTGNVSANNTVKTLSYTVASGITFITIRVGVTNSGKTIHYKDLMVRKSGDATFAPYSNICPITGWTGAKVTRTGKNLLDYDHMTFVQGSYIANDGSIASGSAYQYMSDYLKVKPNTAYTIQLNKNASSGAAISVPYYDEQYGFISRDIVIQGTSTGDVSGTFTTPNNCAYIRLSLSKAEYTTYPMIEEGSTASTYEPFGQTYSITFPTPPGTVYGGTLKINKDGTGKLVVDRKHINVSDYDWSYNNTAPYFYKTFSDAKKSESASENPDKLKSNMYHVDAPTRVAGGSASDGAISVGVTNANIMIKDTRYTTSETFKQSGATVVYELASPIEYPLTAPQVKALLGLNNLYADCGKLSVAYYQDINAVIDTKAPKASPVFTGSISLGRKSGTTVGSGSSAVGYDVEASGYQSHAEGTNSVASGDSSHAEGGTDLFDPTSHTTASGRCSHAEGAVTTASGFFSHSEGVYTVASGGASHAEGDSTTASGENAHSEGFNTVANHQSQHVSGEYNVPDPSTAESTARGNYAEIIGNGTGPSEKSNARALDWSGNEYLKGDLYAECESDSTNGTPVLATLKKKADVINITDTTAESVKSFSDGADGMPMELVVGIEPVQDTHGYDYPWPGGGNKNLFGPNTEPVTGKFLTSNGTFGNSDDWNVSDYIAVLPNTEYTFTPNSTAGSSAKTCYYNSSKEFIDYISSGPQTFTTPANCYYMRLSYRSTSTDIQLEIGSSATSFKPYSNICPITGWTGAKVTRAGKNLIPYPYVTTTTTKNTLVMTDNGDGTITANGTPSANTFFDLFTAAQYFTLKAGTYKIPATGNENIQFQFYKTNGTAISNGSTERTFTLTEDTDAYCFLRFASGQQFSSVTVKPMLLIASETDTEWETYNGTIHTITFPTPPGTVYGGTLKINKDGSGLLTVDRAKITVSGLTTSTIAYSSTTKTFYSNAVHVIPDALLKEYSMAFEGIASKFETYPGASIVPWGDATKCYIGYLNDANDGIRFCIPSKSTIDQEVVDMINGTEICYKLASANEYTLTAEQVTTLLGVNNLWADTGNVLSMEYPADTKTYIDNLFASIVNATGVSF